MKAKSTSATQTPRPLGHGVIEGSVHPHPTLWLHTSKVLGRARKVRELKTLPQISILKIASSIGLTLANLHRDLNCGLNINSLMTTSESLRAVQTDISDIPLADDLIDQILRVVDDFGDQPQVIVHGDFNISNILFEGDVVQSVVDFTETRLGFYEEDLAPIIAELPSFKAPLIAAFENAAGVVINERRLLTSAAIYELFSFVIISRQNNLIESKAAQERLLELLGRIR